MYVDPHDYSTITVLLYGCYPTDVNQLPSAVSFDRVVFVVFRKESLTREFIVFKGFPVILCSFIFFGLI